MHDTIGIDISKERLDAFRPSSKEHRPFPNDSSGHRALLRWMDGGKDILVVFEPTGAYHRRLEAALASQGISFVKVNPRQARRFAEATGTQAKTDRFDGMLLARMGAALDLPASSVRSETLHELRELHVARASLIKDRTAARNRASNAEHAVLKRQGKARLALIDKQLAEIDDAITAIIAQDPALAKRLDILISIPGIWRATAFALLIDMPELGSLDNKQAASLAGLAPVSRQSGTWQGKERIRGGRATLRCAIFMPALVVIRHNQDLKRKYEQLIASGKPAKLAVTAIMRKLDVLANTLLVKGRKWVALPA
jgi:transposase